MLIQFLSLIFFYSLIFSPTLKASSADFYLKRFTIYQQWSAQLPSPINEEFLQFVDSNTPLGNKLREKWLYFLAQQKNWPVFQQHYQTSEDINLHCLAIKVNYLLSDKDAAVNAAKKIWLNGESLPPACNSLFELMLSEQQLDENLLTERLTLALEKRNLIVARYLLRHYKHPRLQDERWLNLIYQNPQAIRQLPSSLAYSNFYLYGLKRLISSNLDKALILWRQALQKQILNDADNQAFIAQVALYKAMRDHTDAELWFAKIKPIYRNELLQDWRIRLALKQQQWSKVKTLISLATNQKEPCWQYWLARAYQNTAEPQLAKAIFQKLATERNYYGFLSSIQLKQNFNFNEQKAVENLTILSSYHSILEQVNALYQNKKEKQASQLLNDFASELTTDELSALTYWLMYKLQWFSKAVNFGDKETIKNQLSLRFPLVYSSIIHNAVKSYPVPKALIYAIIKQESGFRKDVVSHAKAHGLMQILPKTASAIAKKNRIAYQHAAQLFQPATNIFLGTTYLYHLSKHYQQRWLLVVAAYNAGPKQVYYWQQNHQPQDIDIWIDTLAWHETRNYLKNVISFYVVYQHILGEKSDIKAFFEEESKISHSV